MKRAYFCIWVRQLILLLFGLSNNSSADILTGQFRVDISIERSFCHRSYFPDNLPYIVWGSTHSLQALSILSRNCPFEITVAMDIVFPVWLLAWSPLWNVRFAHDLAAILTSVLFIINTQIILDTYITDIKVPIFIGVVAGKTIKL
jgi:hypothetical protein